MSGDRGNATPWRERVEIGAATLYLGDCLDVLPKLEPVDHVIFDPPYEAALQKHFGKAGGVLARRVKDLPFAPIDDLRDEVAAGVKSISRGWVLAFCLAEGVAAWRDSLQAAGVKYDTCLAWVKPDAMPRMNGQGAARGFECVVTGWCGKGYRRWNAGGKRGLYTHNVARRAAGAHPTEKPLPLMAELLRDFTAAGQTVCDPMMGSGTTGVACLRAGRRFVGIEAKPEFFEMARARIADAARQTDLFESYTKPVQEALL